MDRHRERMPPDAARAFAAYLGPCHRSYRAVEELLGHPYGTIKSWAARYGWAARAAAEVAAERGDRLAAAEAAMFAGLCDAIDTALAAVSQRGEYVPDAKGRMVLTYPGGYIDAATARAAFAIIDRCGLGPTRRADLALAAPAGPPAIDQATIERLVAVRDFPTLAKLSTGQLLALPEDYRWPDEDPAPVPPSPPPIADATVARLLAAGDLAALPAPQDRADPPPAGPAAPPPAGPGRRTGGEGEDFRGGWLAGRSVPDGTASPDRADRDSETWLHNVPLAAPVPLPALAPLPSPQRSHPRPRNRLRAWR
jgi:hypothetical protein